MHRKFKVSLEFEVDVNPISVPDAATLQRWSPSIAKQKKFSKAELRAGMKKKGFSDAEIEKALSAKKDTAKDYQYLLYPEYENCAGAQQRLLESILGDADLAETWLREMVRDLTRERVDALLDKHYGPADLNAVLKDAMTHLSDADRATLKADDDGLIHDETEFVDASVTLSCQGIRIKPG